MLCRRFPVKVSNLNGVKVHVLGTESYSEDVYSGFENGPSQQKDTLYFSSFIETFIVSVIFVRLISTRSNFIFSTSAVEVVY